MKTRALLAAGLLTGLCACGGATQTPITDGQGPNPRLPEAHKDPLPLPNIAPAQGWPADGKPTAAAGLQVGALASGLDHPRWLYVLPNGDVLVAETNAPANPPRGLIGRIEKWVMTRAGAGVPSANRISLLRDADGDGVAEQRTVFLKDLNSPFGMALVGGDFYVANTDAVMRYSYTAGATEITAPGSKLCDLPGGLIDRHWTKSLIANADGSKLYVGVGSNSNIGEAGMENEEGRAALWEIDTKTGAHRLYATGLRNPVGLAWEPESSALWVAVNERDELGNDLVPDYMTSVREGGFYGWPYSYYGQHVDERVQPQNPELVEKAIAPDYALGPHTASLGLASSKGTTLPAQYVNGMFVGQHGSWNRKPHSGYKVIFVPFAAGKPSGLPTDVLTGFLSADGKALGRPVGVTLDKTGALLVADDVGNTIWRVTNAASAN